MYHTHMINLQCTRNIYNQVLETECNHKTKNNKKNYITIFHYYGGKSHELIMIFSGQENMYELNPFKKF